MYQYSETELTNKINTFLAKKTLKFPELQNIPDQPSRKLIMKDQKESRFFTALERLNTLWGQRVHP